MQTLAFNQQPGALHARAMVSLGLLGGPGAHSQLRALLSGASRTCGPSLEAECLAALVGSNLYLGYPAAAVRLTFRALGSRRPAQTQSPSWGFGAHLFSSPTQGGVSPPTSTSHAKG